MLIKYILLVVAVFATVHAADEKPNLHGDSFTGHTIQLVANPSQRNVTWDAIFFDSQVQVIKYQEFEKLALVGFFDKLDAAAKAQDENAIVRVLDIGCGPGYFTMELLRKDKTGKLHITCMDIDPAWQAVAKAGALERLTREQQGRLTILTGSVFDTKLASDHFDFVIARFLFQHIQNQRAADKPQVPGTVAAGQELMRVLKPGGVVFVEDSDGFYGDVLHPPVMLLGNLERKFYEYRNKNLKSPKSASRSGTSLAYRLKQSGFLHVTNFATFSNSELFKDGLKKFLPMVHPYNYYSLVKLGVYSQEKYDKIVKEFERTYVDMLHTKKNTRPPFMIIVTMIASGRKPSLEESKMNAGYQGFVDENEDDNNRQNMSKRDEL